jgi:hypothetical protein
LQTKEKPAGDDDEDNELSSVGSLDKDDLIIHFINCGIKEGRKYKLDSIQLQSESKSPRVVFVVARYNEEIHHFAEYNDNLVVYNKGQDDISPSIRKSCIQKVPNVGREAGTYCTYIIENYNHLPEYMIFTQGNPCDHVAIHDPVTTFNKLREIYYEEKNYKFKYISGHHQPFDMESVAHFGIGVCVTPIELGNPKDINELIHDIQKWVQERCPEQFERSKELTRELEKRKTIWPWEFNKLFIGSGWYCTSGEAQTMRHEITRDSFDYSKIRWLTEREEGFSFGYGAIFIVHRDNIRKYSVEYWKRLNNELQELLPGAGWGCERLWGFLLGEGDYYPKRESK